MLEHRSDESAPELAAIDALLRSVSFEPRQSLGPEIASRFAAGERARRLRGAPRPTAAFWISVAAALLIVLGQAWAIHIRVPPSPIPAFIVSRVVHPGTPIPAALLRAWGGRHHDDDNDHDSDHDDDGH